MRQPAVIAAGLAVVLGACTTGTISLTDAQLATQIRAAFADVGCKMTGATAQEAEAPFEAALAKRLNVPVAQVNNRDGDIFKRGDKIVGEMVRTGEIKLSDTGFNATVMNCTPTPQ